MRSETTDEADTIEIVHRSGGPPHEIEVHEVPRYLRDLANSRLNRVNRHSRASSLVSVSTKFTTNTLNDDTRSIDLMLGGQYFRIARDGSRVTDSAPPPYSTIFTIGTQSGTSPTLRALSPAVSEFSIQTGSGRSLDTAFVLSDDEDEALPNDEGFATPRQQSPTRSPDTAIRRTMAPFTLSTPTAEPSRSRPQTALAINDEVPDRHPSYKSGIEVLDVVPRSGRVSRADDFARLGPLRRRNGLRLPSLDTQMRHPHGTGPGRPRSQSAGPILEPSLLEEGPDEPQQPTRLPARRAFTTFPPLLLTQQNQSAFPFTTHTDPDADGSDSDDDSRPLPMDDENDISLHYAGMMRKLDREHRKASQTQAHEINTLRQQLDEKDHVYRQELRGRDFMIEDLRQQLEHMQRQLEETERDRDVKVEKAIFRTEDLWEQRWKEQEFHLRERMKRIEEEAQKTISTMLEGKSGERNTTTTDIEEPEAEGIESQD